MLDRAKHRFPRDTPLGGDLRDRGVDVTPHPANLLAPPAAHRAGEPESRRPPAVPPESTSYKQQRTWAGDPRSTEHWFLHHIIPNLATPNKPKAPVHACRQIP